MNRSGNKIGELLYIFQSAAEHDPRDAEFLAEAIESGQGLCEELQEILHDMIDDSWPIMIRPDLKREVMGWQKAARRLLKLADKGAEVVEQLDPETRAEFNAAADEAMQRARNEREAPLE